MQNHSTVIITSVGSNTGTGSGLAGSRPLVGGVGRSVASKIILTNMSWIAVYDKGPDGRKPTTCTHKYSILYIAMSSIKYS